MSQILEELNQIITTSNLPLEDQNDILVVLPVLPEEAVGTLNKIFKQSPEALKDFNKSFKAKVRALTNEDDKEWEEILKKEKEEIEALEKAERSEEEENSELGDPYGNRDSFDDKDDY